MKNKWAVGPTDTANDHSMIGKFMGNESYLQSDSTTQVGPETVCVCRRRRANRRRRSAWNSRQRGPIPCEEGRTDDEGEETNTSPPSSPIRPEKTAGREFAGKI